MSVLFALTTPTTLAGTASITARWCSLEQASEPNPTPSGKIKARQQENEYNENGLPVEHCSNQNQAAVHPGK